MPLKLSKNQKETLDIAEICALCEHASALRCEDEMLCSIHGVVSSGYHCRKFRYDLLKRKPVKKHPQEPLLTEPLPSLEDDEEISNN